MPDSSGDVPYMTVREMISEMRDDLKEVKAQLVPKEEHDDHESRLRSLEQWKYGIPVTGLTALLTLVVALFVR